ncbi:MAG TPA: SxtJ family membrane protein [Thermoanaerobaculia bacterium]|jgi:hypothetical protein
MSIAQEIRELRPDRRELRKFSWVVGGVLLLIAAVLWYRDPASGAAPVLGWIGAALIAAGTLVPLALKPLYYAWMSLAVVLGFVMTRVLLTVFFFLVLTPFALVFRLVGRDSLHRRLDRQSSTYWLDKEYPIRDRTRFEKFF